MFAVGHLALGYLFGKATSKTLGVNMNMPLMFLLTILPDLDLLSPTMTHRGPTHSIVVLALLSAPFLLFYRKTAIPYAVAIGQHLLIGDFLIGGSEQIFWPLSEEFYGMGICQWSSLNILTEWILFTISVAILYKLGDLENLLKPKILNLTLIVPLISIGLPLFFGIPVNIPIALFPTHLAYFTLLTISIISDFRRFIQRTN